MCSSLQNLARLSSLKQKLINNECGILYELYMPYYPIVTKTLPAQFSLSLIQQKKMTNIIINKTDKAELNHYHNNRPHISIQRGIKQFRRYHHTR